MQISMNSNTRTMFASVSRPSFGELQIGNLISAQIDNEHINPSLVHVRFPPLPEQRAIAAALSDVDALISGLERLIEKKRAIKQGAMQELLTGKRRLPGFSGEWEVQTDRGVVSIPEDWKLPHSASSA